MTNEESSMCVASRCRKGLKDSEIGGEGDEKGMEGWVLLKPTDAGCHAFQTLDICLIPETQIQLAEINWAELVPGNFQKHTCLDSREQARE